MKRAAALAAALAASLLLASCGVLDMIGFSDGGEKSSDGAPSGKTSTHVESAEDGTIAVTNVSAGTILDYFSAVAIGSEYGESARIVCKWQKHISYYIEGDATDDDAALIDRLCERLNEIEGFPGISRTQSGSSANLTVSFVSRSQIVQMFSEADENCAGMASYEWDSATGSILSARCAIDSSLTSERNCTICEEFLQSLGPARDSYMFPTSVFYEGFTLTPFPTDLDFAVMEILYSPSIPVGASRLDALAAAAKLVKWEE